MQPFHVTYERDLGQIALRGGVDHDAVLELEGFGSGLDTSGPWAGGGPFVWIRTATNHRLVGWVRALPREEVGRSGAWEAWGVQTTIETDCSAFAWCWQMLGEGPKSLEAFSAALASSKRRRITDDIPISKLVAILSNFYSRGRRGDLMTIPIEEPEDLPLLPWIWLLGPVQPQNATLSPPRKNVPAMAPPLTYVSIIDGDFDFRQATSPYLQAAVQELITGKADEALRMIQTVRQAPHDKRPRLLYSEDVQRPAPVAKDAKEPATWIPPEADRQTGRSGQSWWRRRWSWSPGEVRIGSVITAVLIGLASATLVLEVMNYLALHPSSEEGNAQVTTETQPTRVAPAATSQPIATMQPAAAQRVNSQPDLSRPGERKDLWPSIREALVNAAKKDGSTKFATEVQQYDPEHKPGDRFRLRVAVAQLYLKSRDCFKGPLGGATGPKFAAALDCAGDDHTLNTLMTSDEELARWLLAHG